MISHKHKHTHACKSMHTHRQAHLRTHTDSTHSQTHMHARMHTQTHTRTHTHLAVSHAADLIGVAQNLHLHGSLDHTTAHVTHVKVRISVVYGLGPRLSQDWGPGWARIGAQAGPGLGYRLGQDWGPIWAVIGTQAGLEMGPRLGRIGAQTGPVYVQFHDLRVENGVVDDLFEAAEDARQCHQRSEHRGAWITEW